MSWIHYRTGFLLQKHRISPKIIVS